MVDRHQADTAGEVFVVQGCHGVCVRASADANECLWWLGKGCDGVVPPWLRSGGYGLSAIGLQRQCDCASSDGDGGSVQATGSQLDSEGDVHNGHIRLRVKHIVDDGLLVLVSLFNLVKNKLRPVK